MASPKLIAVVKKDELEIWLSETCKFFTKVRCGHEAGCTEMNACKVALSREYLERNGVTREYLLKLRSEANRQVVPNRVIDRFFPEGRMPPEAVSEKEKAADVVELTQRAADPEVKTAAAPSPRPAPFDVWHTVMPDAKVPMPTQVAAPFPSPGLLSGKPAYAAPTPPVAPVAVATGCVLLNPPITCLSDGVGCVPLPPHTKSTHAKSG